MIVFFAVAGLLLVAAIFFVVPPLIGKRFRAGDVSHDATNLSIYRDQLHELDADLENGTLDRTQYETAKQEIERRVIEEVEEDAELMAKPGGAQWTLAIVVAVLIPLIAVPMYLVLGTPAALDPSMAAAPQQEGAHDISPQRIAAMMEQLKSRLQNNPDDVEGWVMLAKTSQALGKHDESVRAFREIVKRSPPDAQLLADFADTLAIANGRSLDGEPQQLIEQALAVDPNNVKALALGGTVAFQKKDYAKAALLWRRILESVPAETEFAQRIQSSIAEAESLGGVKPAPVAVAGRAATAPAGTGLALTGRVELDSAVAKSVSSGDTVFIFARAASGPKMPLAIQRITVKDLPFRFELTEAMAMAPGMSIAKFPDLVVGARVSKSGNAIPQTGDWESELVPVKAGATGVKLVISRFIR